VREFLGKLSAKVSNKNPAEQFLAGLGFEKLYLQSIRNSEQSALYNFFVGKR
jgi:hypothetical protein